MFRTVNDQPTLWDAILPSELLVLPVELARVDALLDDPVFFAPFAAYFDARIGRPSIPMETYLRLVFLKFRYRLGYEMLCREVADSISWQRFCRIPLGVRVPHSTTLMKITSRCGDAAVGELNETLVAKAAAGKLLRTDRVRADTTVVCADVGYPTDSGLLAKGIGAIARTVARIKAAGGAGGTGARDRRRSAGRRARSIASKLRLRGAQQRDEAQAAVRRITGELADIAEAAGGFFLHPAGRDLDVALDGALNTIHANLADAQVDRAAEGSRVELAPRLGANDPMIEQLLLAMDGVLKDPVPTARTYVDHLTAMLAAPLAHGYNVAAGSAPAAAVAAGLGQRQLGDVIDVMRLRLAEPIPLADLAAVAGLSTSQLTRRFKASTGVTPHRYLVRLRLAHAARELRIGDRPIADIAVACGFSHQEHLTRTMRAQMGTTPAEVRRSS